MSKTSRWLTLLLFPALGGLAACSDDKGSVQLSVEAEDTVADGLDPGTELENIKDGWRVRYTKLLYVIGDVKAKSSSDGEELTAPTFHVLDLKQLPASGFSLLQHADVAAVRFDQLSFASLLAKRSYEPGPGVSDADVKLLADGGFSLYIEGTLDKADGQSCTPSDLSKCVAEHEVKFAWGVPAATRFEHCRPEGGDFGFAVTSGGTTSHAFTIHGDHWFFNGFPEGAEIVDRQAQWVADADLDHDGMTTVDELKASKASELFPSSKYSFAGSPIPIQTGYDFVIAQSHTIGHFDGEGECEWDVVP